MRGAGRGGRAGIPFRLATMSICSMQDVAGATTTPFWFHLYVMKDRGFTRSLVERAIAAKCSALMMTLAARRAALGGAPVYFYYFAWETPVMGGKLHSPHALEISFVFDNTELPAGYTGGGPKPAAPAAKMRAAWTDFARPGPRAPPTRTPAAAGTPALPAARPSTMANASAERAAQRSTTPTRSGNGRRWLSRESARKVWPSCTLTSAIGMYRKKTQRHWAACTIEAPRVGPRAAPSEEIAPQMVTAVARSRAEKAARRRPSEDGMISALPTPWTIRPPTRTGTPGAKPHTSEPTAKITSPSAKTRRRPHRSAARPAGISSEPKTMLCPLSTHDSSARLLWGNEASSAGKATAMTSRFSETRKTGRPVTARTMPRRGSGTELP